MHLSSCKHHSSCSTQCGLALVSVLWLLLLLTTLTLTLVRESRLAIQSASIYSDELKVRAAIEGAIYESVYHLAIGLPPAQVAASLLADAYELSVVYEHAKLDINGANAAQLAAYLADQELASADVLAARIVDFRDKDDEALQEGGSEQGIYKQEGLEKLPANRNFLHLFELVRVAGLGNSLSDEMLAGLTVFGGNFRAPSMTLNITKAIGRVRQSAAVTLRINQTRDKPIEILRWEWVEG